MGNKKENKILELLYELLIMKLEKAKKENQDE